MRSGQPVPDRILHAPQLDVHLEFFLDAFWKLSTCRQIGMSEGPIPITAIIQYGQLYDCSDSFLQDLVEYVFLLDQVYMDNCKRKMNTKAKK